MLWRTGSQHCVRRELSMKPWLKRTRFLVVWTQTTRDCCSQMVLVHRKKLKVNPLLLRKWGDNLILVWRHWLIQRRKLWNVILTYKWLCSSSRRSHIPNLTEITSYGDRSHLKVDSSMNQQRRPPFSVVAHNTTCIDSTEEQNQAGNVKESDGAQKSSSCCCLSCESISKDAT